MFLLIELQGINPNTSMTFLSSRLRSKAVGSETCGTEDKLGVDSLIERRLRAAACSSQLSQLSRLSCGVPILCLSAAVRSIHKVFPIGFQRRRQHITSVNQEILIEANTGHDSVCTLPPGSMVLDRFSSLIEDIMNLQSDRQSIGEEDRERYSADAF